MAEDTQGYVGVKFNMERVKNKAPKDSRIELLATWCQEFDRRGLAPPYDGGSYENLSLRVKMGHPEFIITASKSRLSDSDTPEKFCLVYDVNFAEKKVYFSAVKPREPSSESMVHALIYNMRPEVQYVFHGHCMEITRLCIKSRDQAEKLKISVTEHEKPYGTLELVDEVRKVLKDNKHTNFIEMLNHGFLSFDETMDLAALLPFGVKKQCIYLLE
jgi:ribulose-5-phosphate 4-epimerase/fuculose-1-phosphate aldolase